MEKTIAKEESTVTQRYKPLNQGEATREINNEEIFERLEQGVKEVYNSDNYKNYLRFMSGFRGYSINNLLFLEFQCMKRNIVPQMFAGFSTWKKLGIRVKKGEKAFSVLAPIIKKVVVAQDDNLTPADESTDVSQSNQFVEKVVGFKVINRTFELSQTDGKDKIPNIVPDLQGTVDKKDEILEALEEVSGIKFQFENISSGAKGYYNRLENKIAIQNDMSDLQTIKTAIHETAHSLLHCDVEATKDMTRGQKEIQAESVAFVVSSALGLDTNEYSFPYIATWGCDKGVELLRENLEVIKTTSNKIIEAIDDRTNLLTNIEKLGEKPNYNVR